MTSRTPARPWRRLLFALLALPLLQMSCLEIAERALINGFFAALTPQLQECLEDRLADCWGEPTP